MRHAFEYQFVAPHPEDEVLTLTIAIHDVQLPPPRTSRPRELRNSIRVPSMGCTEPQCVGKSMLMTSL
jgi:hypothetical protein